MKTKNREKEVIITIGWPWNKHYDKFKFHPQVIFNSEEGLMCITNLPEISISDGDTYELKYRVTFKFDKDTNIPR